MTQLELFKLVQEYRELRQRAYGQDPTTLDGARTIREALDICRNVNFDAGGYVLAAILTSATHDEVDDMRNIRGGVDCAVRYGMKQLRELLGETESPSETEEVA